MTWKEGSTHYLPTSPDTTPIIHACDSQPARCAGGGVVVHIRAPIVHRWVAVVYDHVQYIARRIFLCVVFLVVCCDCVWLAKMSDDREMKVDQQTLHDAKIDLAYRDFCADLLVPLNQCRRATFYMPWKCGHERHTYEKCQHHEYLRRVDLLSKQPK